MSEFDVSDKELKSLLKTEGLESPSVNFNQGIFDKIKASEQESSKPVSAPKWLLVILGVLFIAPSLYFVFSGQSILTDAQQYAIDLPATQTGLSSKFILIGTLALLAIGLTLVLQGFRRRQSSKERVKKS